jgi:hypothetical protein
MSTIAAAVAVLALIGAIASWISGAVFCLRSFPPPRKTHQVLLAVLAWPFVPRTGEGADQSAGRNKALVAFFTCVMIAVAATSLATNLSRLSR